MKVSPKNLWCVGLVFATFVSLSSCKKAGVEVSNEAKSSAGWSFPSAKLEKSLAAIPGDAALVGSVVLPRPFWDYLTGEWSFIPVDAEILSELQTELKAHFDRHTGLDFHSAQVAVAYLAAPAGPNQEPNAAVIVHGVSGELTDASFVGADGKSEYQGVTLWTLNKKGVLAVHKDHVIVGNEPGVQAVIDTLQGKNAGLKSEKADFYSYVSSNAEGAWVSAAASVGSLPIPENPYTDGLRRGSIRVGASGIRVAVQGKKETLELLKAPVTLAMSAAKAELAQEKQRSSDELFAGVEAIVGYHMAVNAMKLLAPKVEGEVLRMELPFSEDAGGGGAALIAIAGVSAAVAVPAFMKYIKKSKATEAKTLLNGMHDGAVAYHSAMSKFPASVGPTPPLGTCCASGEKCQPEAALWTHPSWNALNFAIREPHYFSYQFDNSGDEFTVRAFGDLDCDGVFSTFEMTGPVGENSPGNFVVSRELE